VTFSDPELALESFKPDFYALVLIDIMMPKMSGFELYEQLKKVDPDIKVCFLTASEMYSCYRFRSQSTTTKLRRS
jgi:CheY-like chemotaxis protein